MTGRDFYVDNDGKEVEKADKNVLGFGQRKKDWRNIEKQADKQSRQTENAGKPIKKGL